MKVKVLFPVVLAWLATPAWADGPSLSARLALGMRSSSSLASGDNVYDDTSRPRFAAEALVGLRFGRFVVGVHGGIATPLQVGSVEYVGEAETYPSTETNIYPVDLGVGGTVDLQSGFWVSGWIGATIAFAHASSPAAMVNNIEFYGSVPAAAWRYRTTSLGGGGAFGYDLAGNDQGRLGLMLGLDLEGIGPIPVRYAMGTIGTESRSNSATSLTLGVAYTY